MFVLLEIVNVNADLSFNLNTTLNDIKGGVKVELLISASGIHVCVYVT